MISPVLSKHTRQLQALAKAWTASGAASVSIWQDAKPLFQWPAAAETVRPFISERISFTPSANLEIRVAIQDTPATRARLRADAGLIAQVLLLNEAVNGMAAELVDTQDQLLAIYNLTQATRNHIAIEKLLKQLTYETYNLISKLEGVFILLELPGNVRCLEFYPSPVFELSAIEGALECVRKSGEVFLSSENQGLIRLDDLQCLALLPVQIRGARFAALGLVKRGGDFMSPEMKLAQAIAQHAGAQIENVLLYQKNLEQMKLRTEMELARQVQLNLLPHHPPSVAGVELWARSRPALQVGGDFYDFHSQSGTPLSFTVGDISGKGLPAALLMSMTRTVIRSKVNGFPTPSPGQIVQDANHELYNDFTDVNMFATVFIGQYNPDERILTFANAGHSPVVYCPEKGKAELLEADGTALGVLPDSLSKDQQIELRPNDVLVVGTDGLSEAQNEHDELFGYDRLLHLIETCAALPAAQIGAELYREVNAFSAGQPQFDDQTVMVLKGIEA